MPTKYEPGGKSRIPHLLRCAFREADNGDREMAMSYWNQAIHEGYAPVAKTKKQLMYKLRVANGSAQEGGPV